MKKPTIKDIAARAGVSTACVSMILNRKNLSRFSEETIANVYRASQEYGYTPRSQQFHKNPKKLILIICPSVMNPYYATLIQGMEQEAWIRGYMTLIFTTYWDTKAESEALKLAEEPFIAGVIFAMFPQQPAQAEEIGRRIPMTTVGDRNLSIQIDTVDVNNYEAGRMVAMHLISLGHKHIAYISTTLTADHSSRVNRCRGLQDEYQNSCPGGSVTIFSEDVSSEKERNVVDVEQKVGYSLAQRCLKEAPQTTAIVAINDMVAYGVRQALIDMGKKIPDDISLCGFDNIYPSRFHGIELTTVEHAIVERGRGSVRLLAEKLNGQTDAWTPQAITRLEYQSRLIAGSTTGIAREPSPTPAERPDPPAAPADNGEIPTGTDRN